MGQNNVFKTQQQPWFIAKSLPARLLQAWFVLFFILTWACVKKIIFAGPNLIGPLPAPLFWVWFLDFLTVIILYLAYHYHFKGLAAKVDTMLEQSEKVDPKQDKGGAS